MILVGSRAIASHNQQVQQATTVAENITGQVAIFYPPALGVLEMERVFAACFGEFAALVTAHGGAAQAAAAHPEADAELLKQVEAVLQQHPDYVAQAAAMFKIQPAAATSAVPAKV